MAGNINIRDNEQASLLHDAGILAKYIYAGFRNDCKHAGQRIKKGYKTFEAKCKQAGYNVKDSIVDWSNRTHDDIEDIYVGSKHKVEKAFLGLKEKYYNLALGTKSVKPAVLNKLTDIKSKTIISMIKFKGKVHRKLRTFAQNRLISLGVDIKKSAYGMHDYSLEHASQLVEEKLKSFTNKDSNEYKFYEMCDTNIKEVAKKSGKSLDTPELDKFLKVVIYSAENDKIPASLDMNAIMKQHDELEKNGDFGVSGPERDIEKVEEKFNERKQNRDDKLKDDKEKFNYEHSSDNARKIYFENSGELSWADARKKALDSEQNAEKEGMDEERKKRDRFLASERSLREGSKTTTNEEYKKIEDRGHWLQKINEALQKRAKEKEGDGRTLNPSGTTI